jgi:predicted dehydrogenase
MSRRLLTWLTIVAVTIFSYTTAFAGESAKPVRVGMIGLDTSHVVAFTRIMNDPNATGALKDVQVVTAWPGGNPNFPLSRDRVQGFTRQVKDMGVKIVDSIEELLSKVDAILLESVDGSQHLEQVRPVFEAGKPVFIDKPLTASLVDAVAIYELSKKYDVPWFSASSSRFTPGYRELRNDERVGDVLGCDAYSQSRAAPFHPDLFWYGVHGIDVLYEIMGRGCTFVTAIQTRYTESVCGLWSDGRVGRYRSIREHTGRTGLGVIVFGTKGIVYHNRYYDYVPLCAEIASFFKTRKPPVELEETLEVFAFMEAAEESKRRGGVPVSIAEVMEKARRSPTSLGVTPSGLIQGM